MLSVLGKAMLMAAGGGRPIPYVGADGSTNTSSSGTSIALGQPPATLINWLVLSAMIAKGGAFTWSGPAGMDERIDQGALPNLRIATKTATVAGLAYLGNATLSSSGDATVIGVAISNGAYDTIGAFGTRSGTGTLTAPSITMSKSGLLMTIVGMEGNGGTISSDTSMAILKNYGSGVYPEMSIYYEYVPAGATGTRSFTIGGTSPGACSAVLVGIKRG